jgi:hypothetical protein
VAKDLVHFYSANKAVPGFAAMTHLTENRVILHIEPHCVPYRDSLGNPQPDAFSGNLGYFGVYLAIG